MKVAITSEDGRRVSGHAGQARQWLVFEVDENQAVGAPQAVELEREQVFHHHRQGAHPLDGINVIISASAGEGFLKRMEKRGVRVALTGERDVHRAAHGLITNTLKPPLPRGVLGLVCKLRDLFSEHL